MVRLLIGSIIDISQRRHIHPSTIKQKGKLRESFECRKDPKFRFLRFLRALDPFVSFSLTFDVFFRCSTTFPFPSTIYYPKVIPRTVLISRFDQIRKNQTSWRIFPSEVLRYFSISLFQQCGKDDREERPPSRKFRKSSSLLSTPFHSFDSCL